MLKVELYGKFAELAGRELAVDLALPASLAALSTAMAEQHPMLVKALAHPRTRFCVNDVVVLGEVEINAGDNVALFPPLSGG